ncbi:hypothetical protein FQR65_LT20469 [Abscondita terminalis]|nr:hypothetical protein FQR65_LT20469 [Abscondita terminalis]
MSIWSGRGNGQRAENQSLRRLHGDDDAAAADKKAIAQFFENSRGTLAKSPQAGRRWSPVRLKPLIGRARERSWQQAISPGRNSLCQYAMNPIAKILDPDELAFSPKLSD